MLKNKIDCSKYDEHDPYFERTPITGIIHSTTKYKENRRTFFLLTFGIPLEISLSLCILYIAYYVATNNNGHTISGIICAIAIAIFGLVCCEGIISQIKEWNELRKHLLNKREK